MGEVCYEADAGTASSGIDINGGDARIEKLAMTSAANPMLQYSTGVEYEHIA